jgi:hypothetical protein
MAIPTAGRQALANGIISVLQQLDHAYLGIGDVVQAFTESVQTAKDELQTFGDDWVLEAKFKTRVINVPKAFDQAKLTVDDLKRIFVNEFENFRQVVADFEQAIHSGGSLHEPGEPALAAAVTTLQDLHAFFERLADFIRQVFTITRVLNRIKHEILSLDPLFLQQGNPKSTIDEHYRKRIKRNG